MAEQAQKRTKVVDKWKLKSWYSVIAPEAFESREICQIVSADEANLLNRKVRIGLGEMTGSFSQSAAYTTLFFRVKEVKGKTAHTIFTGHELVPGYVRTLARRRRSIIHQVDDVITKDNVKIRIKTICITGLKVSEAVRTDVRKGISEAVQSLAKQTDFNTLVQEMVFGKLAAKIYSAIKKIGPIKRVEIRKSELHESFS
ncbi:MAG: 30S ribosomal protein S3ae [Candidatus Micrarchaeota archaeon]|nr:30S ribosomal protein S3ae [Candidatus Micrarchaeota archaeon]